MNARPENPDSKQSSSSGSRTPDDRSASERTVDDLTPEDLAAEDIALTADDATRGPFRPNPPPTGDDEGFMRAADGQPRDPVYREATPEVDVYEDLPSRRARAEPEEATEDAASPEDPEAAR